MLKTFKERGGGWLPFQLVDILIPKPYMDFITGKGQIYETLLVGLWDIVDAPVYLNYAPCNLSRCYNLDDNSTQSLIRTYLNSSLAKTQGSLYVHTGKRLIRY